MQTIPDDVLDRLAARFPDFPVATLVANLRRPGLADGQIAQIEKAIPDSVPHARVFDVLTPLEWLALCRCAAAEPYRERAAEWLTVTDAAREYGHGYGYLYRLIREAKLAGAGRRETWIRRADIEGWERDPRGRPRTDPSGRAVTPADRGGGEAG